MIVTAATMFVIPFPNQIGSGIAVNLNIECPKIQKLKEKYNVDDITVCKSFYVLFSNVNLFNSANILQIQLNLLNFIHDEKSILSVFSKEYLKFIYNRNLTLFSKDSNNFIIPYCFWEQ